MNTYDLILDTNLTETKAQQENLPNFVNVKEK